MVLGAMKFSGPKPLPLVGVVLLISKTRYNTSPRLTDRGGFQPVTRHWNHPAAHRRFQPLPKLSARLEYAPGLVFSIHRVGFTV